MNYTNNKMNTMPWLSSQSSSPTTQTLQNKGHRGNIIFNNCSNISDDPYWKNILYECYKGSFPKGISYKDGFLLFKNQMIEVPDNPYLAYPIIIACFRSNCYMKSSIDKEREKDKEMEEYNYLSIVKNNWSEFRKQCVKDILIAKYIDKMCDILNLTRNEQNQLKTIISIGLSIGHINANNIILSDGEIKDIQSLKWDPNTRLFNIIEYKQKKRNIKSIKLIDDDDLIYTHEKRGWTRYMKSFVDTIPLYKHKYHNTSIDQANYTNSINNTSFNATSTQLSGYDSIQITSSNGE